MKKFCFQGILIVSALLANTLSAVVMIPLEIEAMAGKARLIVQGTVRSKTCQQDKDGRIFTRIELQISDVWKGTVSGNRLDIIQGGGTLGERRSIVSGQAEYHVDEEVVGFFVMNDRGEAITLGLAQGKFYVWQDGRTGEKLAANPFHGHGRRPGGKATASANDNVTLSLVQLKQRVQGARR